MTHDPFKKIPFLWQLIYEEGLRSNHLIFSKTDLEAFSSERTHEKPKRIELDGVLEDFMSMLSCHDLSTLCRLVKELPMRKRKLVFDIYLHFLRSWQYRQNQILN